MNDSARKRLQLTVICPVYNEEESVSIFVDRFDAVREQLLASYDVDLIFTNNASIDGTLELIRSLSEQKPYIYFATLSRNAGYQISMECGLKMAKGDLFTFIDVDCEDPPEMIIDFIREFESGEYDIIYGERSDREEAFLLKQARKLFYRLLKEVGDDEIILDMAEFSLFTREVRDAIIQETTAYPFIRASIGRVGFRRKAISYKRNKRAAGSSKFSAQRLTWFALAGIFASTSLPLLIPIRVLPAFMVIIIGLAIWRVFDHSRVVEGAIIVLLSVYLACSAAFIAIYTRRTYKNSMRRPNFFISEKYSRLQ